MSSTNTAISNRLRITYVGHATLLIKLGDTYVLTDPNYDKKLGRFLPRVSDPGVKMAELPSIDAVLLTHAHADHLSFSTLRALPTDVPVYAPPSIASWLKRVGIASARPINAGGELRIRSMTVTAAKARHAGARYVVDRWRGDAYMYLLDDGTSSVLFTGDTAINDGAVELTRKILPRKVDVALLPIGHAAFWKRRSFRRGHLTAEDALSLFSELNARTLIPFHWGTFRHITSGAYDAIQVLRSLLAKHPRAADVKILAPGETYAVFPEE